MAENSEMSGCERAAIFLMSLGEQEAAQIMRHMEVPEVKKISEAMKRLSAVSRDQADSILTAFTEDVDSKSSMLHGSPAFVQRVLTQSLGDQAANPLVERLFPELGNRVESLYVLDAEEIVEAIQGEHPQVVALALVTLEADKAAQVLEELPLSLSTEAVARIARMEEITEAALEDLEQVMHKRFRDGGRNKSRMIGGLRSAAEILNRTEKQMELAVLEELTKLDEELSEQIQENMFVFENLESLDDRGMQVLLREIDSNVLMVALKGASPGMKTLVFKNMSKRAAELLESDMDAMGPVKISEVEEGQKEIVAAARKLAEAGTIALGKSSDEFV
jgi:flagellar motor switch protein FliG